MRIHDLFEAPISHLDVHGMDAAGSFSDVDRKLLRNPQHIAKIKQRFAHTDVDFALYFVNQKAKSYLKAPGPPGSEDAFSPQWAADLPHAGRSDAATVARLFGVTVRPDPGAISVVMVSNANVENSVPLTPWIIAHRFGHALTDNYRTLPPAVQRLINWIPKDDHTVAGIGPHEITLQKAMTMRSARSGTLSAGDTTEELIAQYLMQGQVKLDVPAGWPDKASETSLRMQVIRKAGMINDIISEMLAACVGELFVAL